MQSRVFVPYLITLLLVFSCTGTTGENDVKISIVPSEAERKVDIIINGRFFTSYQWPEDVYKPVLFPVLTSSGVEITRGFPLKPRIGEQTDHIHQVGIWLNYGNVNGIDFWGNGHRGVREPDGGEIRHKEIERMQSKNGEGILVASAEWLTPSGKILIHEKTEFHFIARGSLRIIDRITTLTAGDTTVHFADTKEGMFGIRVARQLELPSRSGIFLVDSTGNPSKTMDTSNKGVSGNYLSSEGLQGEAVWGTRAKWMNLYGTIGDEKVSVAVCDHPRNPGYPTYWHARGYGLFAANPLGRKDFTKGKEEFNFSIEEKEKAVFRYRVVISSGILPGPEELNALSEEFAGKYRK
jgi:hypothetical protein